MKIKPGDSVAEWACEVRSSQMCDSDCCVRALIFGLIALVFGLVGMLCMTAGYVNNTNFNDDITKATCVVVSSTVQAGTCTESCNCNGNNCGICTFTCFNAIVTASIAGVTSGSTVEVVGGLLTPSDATAYLAADFPNGASFVCFYNTNANNTGQVSIFLSERNAESSFIAGLVFCGLTAATILIWIVVEIIVCGPDIADCCRSCFQALSCVSCRQQCRIALQRRRAAKQAATEQKAAIEEQKRVAEEEKRRQFDPQPEDFSVPPNPYAQPPTAPPSEEVLRNSELKRVDDDDLEVHVL